MNLYQKTDIVAGDSKYNAFAIS